MIGISGRMTPEYARGWGQLLPDADAGPGGWSSRDKFAAVLKTAALNEADLAEYCRKRGLFPEQIKAWRVACEQANDWDRSRTAQIGFVDGLHSPSRRPSQCATMMSVEAINKASYRLR